MREAPGIEWPTLALILGCYALWALGTTVLSALWPPLGFVVTMLAITLHSSLQHEVLHGHPFASRPANEALMFLPLGVIYPYGRFRDLHLAHHRDENLTDPYDDPESNYMDPKVWVRLSPALRVILRANNTLLGRMLIGPAVSVLALLRGDLAAIRAGDRAIRRDWLLHLAGMVPVLVWLVSVAAIPFWLFVLSCYGALSILKIRTFLEHQAHERVRGRTVIIEDRGPLALMVITGIESRSNLSMIGASVPGGSRGSHT